jgi:glycosyltransferase involved in cell wall biosynthesis
MSDAPVKVLMLGWEFPPFITGGLGTACHGLTKALDELGTEVTFVLPKGVHAEAASHVRLVAPGLDTSVPAAAPVIRLEDFRAGAAAPPGGHAAHAGPAPGPAAPPGASGPAPEPPGTPDTEARAARTHAAREALHQAAHAIAAAHAPGPLARSLGLLTAPFVADGAYRAPLAGRVLEHLLHHGAAFPRALRPGALAGDPGAARHGRVALPAGLPANLLDDLDEAMRQEMLAALEAWEAYGSDNPADAAEFIEMIRAVRAAVPEAGGRGAAVALGRGGSAPDYSGDLLAQSEAYAHFCVETCRDHAFDVIHAHDWLTYPAGIALARVTGRPLVVHVHSTEFDRSGTHVNQPVYNIERRGMHSAVRVITVSMLTRNICHNRYGVPLGKCDVVYNGVDLDPKAMGLQTIARKDKVVLYFGRITMQKGPEYFVQAARRVLDVMEDVKFVVAGSGDQAQRMIELAASLGIGHKMLFTGFLRGKDIQRVFQIADVYVMPSVSEPFGIAPLEALGHRVPALISRQSGVSEVLQNALKFDFWDTEDLANKIVAVLRHPPLQRTLREEGFDEVRGITWEGAARKTLGVYRRAMAAVGRRGA